ncbi:mediator of RNA polymerase II transcription subunit 8 [Lithohypha guttulata]|uniref:Mediator of RNA polymerase II transcription subunit 8 n=1 Tax=Lithohypha guttulata TaxID=1690604 RepID=A0AAN7YLH9_9EURO|nr:mediator of RNA polymerase II transcription subunit 8 [Lithohypha guttulata]KAK5100366.1 mediator of RNA polymerase II transcription subunit 8 [Lithohypha guttulata]
MSTQNSRPAGVTTETQSTDPTTRGLEDLLRRAQILNGALNSCARDLGANSPLLSFPVMQARLTQIQEEFNRFVTAMSKHAQLLQTTVVTPTPNFPAPYHAGIVDVLFRTLHDPQVNDWEDRGVKMAIDRENRQDREQRDGRMTTLSNTDRELFWQQAHRIFKREGNGHAFPAADNNDFTLEEVRDGIENVRHGLKRELVVPDPDDYVLPMEDEDEDENRGILGDDADDDSEGEDAAVDDDTMAVDQPASRSKASATSHLANIPDSMPIDNVLRFMTKG